MQFIILSLGCPLPNAFSKEQVSVGSWVYLPQSSGSGFLCHVM